MQIVATIGVPDSSANLDVVKNPIERKVGILDPAGAVVFTLIVIVFMLNNEGVGHKLFAANLDCVLHCLSFLLVTTR